ncbi:MAG: hypothetical protein ABIJ50_06565 [Pseudomonadota bacterium]
MGLISTPTTVRVLILTSQGLHAYIRQGNVLTPEGWFPADEIGQAAFDRYLNDLPDIPLYLVADVIEEDFRLENVAHVRGKDRTVLLERKLSQFFRTSDYRAALLQGRDERGRRDDKVLFCALTNNEQLTFWVNRILVQQAPLKGILSVPWLMESFAASRQLARIDHLLLVHLEQHGGLRQTYIHKGRLKFSRLTYLATLQDGRLKFNRLTSLVTIRASNLADMIVAECSHTRQYLERLKLLPRDQPLDVHLIVQDAIAAEIRADLGENEGLRLHLQETGIVAADLGLKSALDEDQGVVFLALTQSLRSKGLVNVYGSPSALRYHRLRKIRKGLMITAACCSVATLAIGTYLLLDGLTQRGKQQSLYREVQQLEQQYHVRQQNFPATPIPAQAMQSVVAAVDMIKKQTVYPMEMMGLVSQALALCPDIRLQKLDWKLTDVEESQEGVDGRVLDRQSSVSGEQGHGEVPGLLTAILAGKTAVITILEGGVEPSGGYLGAQESVNRFISALQQIPGLKVLPLAMPTETSPDSILQATLDGKAIHASFSLQLAYPARQ